MSAVTGLAVWVVAAATPAPGPVGNLDDNPAGGGTPGLAGFLFTFALAVVVIGLAISLVRGMRRMERNSTRLEAPGTTPVPGGPPAAPVAEPTGHRTDAPSAGPTGHGTPPRAG